MKSILTVSIIAAMIAGPVVAQQAQTGGMTMQVADYKGSGTLKNTTADLGDKTGGQVHTSTDKNDGETPNGGAGTGGDTKPSEK